MSEIQNIVIPKLPRKRKAPARQEIGAPDRHNFVTKPLTTNKFIMQREILEHSASPPDLTRRILESISYQNI